jgi:tryptophan synthase beta chain
MATATPLQTPQVSNLPKPGADPDAQGFFGPHGGVFVPPVLEPALKELADAYFRFRSDSDFLNEYRGLLRDYSGRATPLFKAENLSRTLGGATIYLKREDLNHLGAHKLNNVLGQILLAKRMGKTRIIAETGAGQHGVAAAAASALMGMQCTVYMGEEDTLRQQPNVLRMRMMGAKVVPVTDGLRTLKEAVDAAVAAWAAEPDSFYLLGSAVGPHPYPLMVRDFQSVIGKEAREQCLAQIGGLPDAVLACVGGGSNAIGMFHAFIQDSDVRLIGVEPGGRGAARGDNAATMCHGTPGVLHGFSSYLLQDADGEVSPVYSISAGLDYPGVGPEHALLKDAGRAEYVAASDAEAVEAFLALSRREGIIPALESSHALAHAMKLASTLPKDARIVVCLSGRGDKDMPQMREIVERNGSAPL